MIGAEWPIADAVALTKGNDGKFSVTKALAPGEYEYKYVCSKDWDYVEKTAENEDILNRVINVPNTAATATQEDVVAKWAKVPGEVVVDKTELKTLLDAHYVDTLAVLNFLVETDTVELVGTIGNHTVTWASNNAAVINPETGVVTRPAYTDGSESFVVLTASAEGQNDVIYVVKVPQLPETLDQKLEKELTRLTNFPSSYKPILKVSINLAELKDVFVDGEVVTQATWESSDPTLLTHEGQLTGAEFEGDKDVIVSVTFTYEGITKSKDVTFTIRGVRLFSGFLEMIEGPDKGAKGDMVKITEGVSFYANTNDGYYLIDKDGILLFVYGTSGKPASDKLFTPKFELDLYYASPQAKGITYTEVTDGTPHTEASITEITLDELVKKSTPSDDAPLVHRLYKVTGAKLHTFDLTDNYMTYLVPQSHDDPTKQPNKSDSMMLYYQTPGGLSRLQEFAPLNETYSIDFEHIVIVVSAFRTNNDIFAFMFLGDVDSEADVKLGQATPTQAAEQALMQAAGQIQTQIFVDGSGFNLVPKASFQGTEFDITYSSGNPTHVGHDGSIVLFPTPGTIENVEFTLTTAVDGVDITLKHTVKLGRPATTKIDEAVATAGGTVVAFEGYLYDGANNTWQFGNPDSEFGAAIRYFDTDLTVGKWYLVIAEKASDYNGLPQMNHIGFVQLEDKLDEFVPAKYTGDLTSTELAKIKNQIVAIDGLEVAVAPSISSSGVLTYTLKNGAGQTIAFREHQSKTDYIDAVMALNLEVGDFVNVKSAVVSWFNNPQFLLGVLEVAEVSEEQLFDQSVGRFQATLPADNVKHYEDFNLAITFENLSIAWSVTSGEAAASIDATGKVTVTKLDAETTVVLTGTVTEAAFTATVTVSVKVAAIGQEPPTETLLKTIDFGTVSKTGYVAGTLTFTNGDGVEYSFNKDRAQTNTSKYAPHDTQGCILVLSSISSAQFAFVEIDLTATAGLTKVSIDFSVWNQNNFDKITGLAGSAIQFEKLDGETWVAVAATTGETNLLSLLTVDVYTTVTFDNLTAGKYRITYSAPGNTSTSNTEYAVTADDIKIYGIQ
jgi:hypothetical protein